MIKSIVGSLCVIIGVIWGIYAYSLETRVLTDISPVRWVHNIGLIAEQQKNLFCAGVVVIGGILLYGFGAAEILAESLAKNNVPSARIENPATPPTPTPAPIESDGVESSAKLEEGMK